MSGIVLGLGDTAVKQNKTKQKSLSPSVCVGARGMGEGEKQLYDTSDSDSAMEQNRGW